MKLNIPALDISAANNGRSFEYMNGVSFTLARYGNPAHAKGLRAILSKYDGKDDAENLSQEVAELIADTILLGWEGLTDGSEDDLPIPYSRDVAVELMTAEEYTHLQGWVERTSKDMANFYQEESSKTVKS